MKKTIITVFLLVSIGTFTTQAQKIAKHAIGIRLTYNNKIDGEISYQHKTSKTNRFEVGINISNNNYSKSYNLQTTYQTINPIRGNFNYYAGYGLGLSFRESKIIDDSNFTVQISGIAGIEYNFNLPILISLDIMPIAPISNPLDFTIQTALSIRYQF